MAKSSCSIPSLIVRISLFNHERITQIHRGYLPLTLHTYTIICTLVMHIMLSDVLLDERNMPVGTPVSADSKVADLVSAIALHLVIEDIQVVDGHLMVLSVLLIDTLPDLVGAGHLEGTAVLFQGPGARNLMVIQLAIVQHLVFAEVLLLEVSKAAGLNITL